MRRDSEGSGVGRRRGANKMTEMGSLLRPAEQGGSAPPASWPGRLNHVDEQAFSKMEPADVLVLDEAPNLRTSTPSAFHAVVACPACGKFTLITRPQYAGVITVICPSDDCTCSFRIQDGSMIAYLAVN